MKCCHCKTTSLEPKELEPGLLAAACPDCNGALLPLMNYRYWSEHNPTVSTTSTKLSTEATGAKQCPKCQGLMTKFRLGPDTQNRLELCVHCDEVWLDAGEWELVKQLDLHGKLSSVFTDAWQRNIRKQKEIANIHHHFAKLIGEQDFARIEDFKNWLEHHPHKADIKHYINTNF